jgi:hypothetical protein
MFAQRSWEAGSCYLIAERSWESGSCNLISKISWEAGATRLPRVIRLQGAANQRNLENSEHFIQCLSYLQ